MDLTVDNNQGYEATAVNCNQVDDDLAVNKQLPVKSKIPKRDCKFGKGAKRGGDQKLGSGCSGTVGHIHVSQEPTTADVHASSLSVPMKQMNKKQLHRKLDWSAKNFKCVEKKVVTESKKLIAARAQFTVLAKLAQEQCKEGHLAHHQAERDVNAICDKSEKMLHLAACKIAAAKTFSDNALAEAHAKLIAK